MAIVLWDINVSKRLESGNLVNKVDTAAKMLPLSDYYEIARRCIGAFASGTMARSMLRNEDAISFVAEHLMYATCRWNSEAGRTLHSYINQCAIWSIQRWILLNKKSSLHRMASLNNDNDGDNQPLYATIPDESTTQPLDELCYYETTDMIRKIMDTELTHRQRECIELIYIHGVSGADAARKLGVSRQAVEQCTTKGITKLRTILNDQISK